MAIIVQVVVVNDEGETEVTYAKSFDCRDSWDAARAVREFFGLIFKRVFGVNGNEFL